MTTSNESVPRHTATSDVKYIQNSAKPKNPNSKEQAQRRFMQLHLKYRHLPFGILIQAACQGTLPPNIICEEHLKCLSSLYSKSIRRPWQTKASHGTIAPIATKPGNCVSVDQMVSSIPVFLTQNTGKLTQDRSYFCGPCFTIWLRTRPHNN